MNQPLLQADDLHFAYGKRPALRGVALTLAGGEVVALLGPNGSGKSTLIKCLLGHLHARGTVAWDGKNLRQWHRRDLAKRVAYLPQTPAFEPGQSVLEILRLGRSPYWRAFGIESARDEQVVREIAGQMELLDLLNRPVEELSGGQRQRVFIGRCLVQQPAALLLDEPNAFLDLRHQFELCRMLRNLAERQSLAVLMALHDLNLAANFADRAILLHEGAVASSGPCADLQADILSNVYGIPMQRVERADGPPILIPRAG